MPDPASVTCPYCGAKPGMHCRTMNGNLTGKFGTRVNHYRREVAARKAGRDKVTGHA
jgi:hypothetical protein